VEIAVCAQMSEVVEPGLDAVDRQNRFVSEHLRRIFVQIYRIVDNVADAQDLTQETFIKALQHQEQLKDEQKAAHWLSRIATNTAIDFLRRNSRATFCEIDEAPESQTESPEQELLRGEHRGQFAFLGDLMRRHIEAALAIWGLFNPTGPIAHGAHLGGMLTGIVFMKWYWNDVTGSPRWEWPQFLRRRSSSTIITPPRRTWRATTARLKTEEVPSAEFISSKVDPILEKISAKGIHSLTEE